MPTRDPKQARQQHIEELDGIISDLQTLAAEAVVCRQTQSTQAAIELIRIAKSLLRLSHRIHPHPLTSRHRGRWRLKRSPGQRASAKLQLLPDTKAQRQLLQQEAGQGRHGFVAMRWRRDHLELHLYGLYLTPGKDPQ